MRSIEFGPDFQLHLHMRKIIARYLPCQKHHHHVEGTVVAMKLACSLDQNFPVLRVLAYIVL